MVAPRFHGYIWSAGPDRSDSKGTTCHQPQKPRSPSASPNSPGLGAGRHVLRRMPPEGYRASDVLEAQRGPALAVTPAPGATDNIQAQVTGSAEHGSLRSGGRCRFARTRIHRLRFAALASILNTLIRPSDPTLNWIILRSNGRDTSCSQCIRQRRPGRLDQRRHEAPLDRGLALPILSGRFFSTAEAVGVKRLCRSRCCLPGSRLYPGQPGGGRYSRALRRGPCQPDRLLGLRAS